MSTSTRWWANYERWDRWPSGAHRFAEPRSSSSAQMRAPALSLERESKAWLDDLKARRRAGELSDAEIEEALENGPPAGWGAGSDFLAELGKLTNHWWQTDDPHRVPIPLAACGTLRTNFVFSPLLEAVSEQAVRSRTIDLLDHWGSRPLLVASDDDQVVFGERVATSLTKLSSEASNILAQLLSDPPVLRCGLRHPREWVRRPAMDWLAYDTPAMEWVPVTTRGDAGGGRGCRHVYGPSGGRAPGRRTRPRPAGWSPHCKSRRR